MKTDRIFSRIVVFGIVLLATACQFGSGGPSASDRGGAEVLGLRQPKKGETLEQISLKELRGYCPKVILRQGTAFHTDFEKGGEGDRSKIRYQAAISDVTRACRYGEEMLTMNVAAAGKVVPGPVSDGNSATLPIRIVATRGSEVLYSQLHTHVVATPSGSGATQFVFSDPNVQIPNPTEANYRIYVGFDDGKGDDD